MDWLSFGSKIDDLEWPWVTASRFPCDSRAFCSKGSDRIQAPTKNVSYKNLIYVLIEGCQNLSLCSSLTNFMRDSRLHCRLFQAFTSGFAVEL